MDNFSQPCIQDPLISLTANANDIPPPPLPDDALLQPCDVFAETYREARYLFQSTARQIKGAQLYSLPVSSVQETMDIAVLPGDLPGLVIHSSGTHGVEGYAGSAIQKIAHMKAYNLVEPNHSRSNQPTLVLVHAVNPWTMARFRRTNENNVDLNRNALTPEEWKKAPHHVNHEAYQKLYSFLNPSTPLDTLWSLTVWASKTEAVTWIDVHTGLGDLGVDTYLLHPAAYDTLQQVESVVQDVMYHFPGLHTPLAGISHHAAAVMQGYNHTIGLRMVPPIF